MSIACFRFSLSSCLPLSFEMSHFLSQTHKELSSSPPLPLLSSRLTCKITKQFQKTEGVFTGTDLDCTWVWQTHAPMHNHSFFEMKHIIFSCEPPLHLQQATTEEGCHCVHVCTCNTAQTKSPFSGEEKLTETKQK